MHQPNTHTYTSILALLPLNYPGIILNLHPGIEALICSWL
jgi:hypothetical protein